MNSTLILYKNCKITIEKNIKVDDVAIYLDTLDSFVFSDYQYIKNDLMIDVRVASTLIQTQTEQETTTEDLLNPRETARFFNYASIQNESDLIPFYYFVIDKRWTSSGTINLTLKLDTINTFKPGIDYIFTEKTRIIREHRDRILNSYVTDGDDKLYRRRIDIQSEGLSPVLYKSQEQEVVEYGADYDWYVMYKADNEQTGEFPPKAVSAYIFANEPLYISGSDTGYALDTSRLVPGKYYIFGRNIPETESDKINIAGQEYDIDSAMILYLQGTSLVFAKFTGVVLYGICIYETIAVFSELPDIVFSSAGYVRYIDGDNWTVVRSGSFEQLGARVVFYTEGTLTAEGEGVSQTIDDISTVDRSSTTIFKIIKIPYAPFKLAIDGGEILIPDYLEPATISWVTGSETITKKYLRVKTSKTGAYINSVDNDITPFANMFTKVSDTDLRNDDNESKLYHSDFYYNKFVYDSFGYPIQFEKISEEKLEQLEPDSPLDFNFVTSSTGNSRFLFDFKGLQSKANTEDYQDILNVSRNNEMPLYNSDYINYVRTGYNYDVKNRNAAIFQGVLSTVGSGISLAAGIAGVNTMMDKAPDKSLATLYAAGQVSSGVSGVANGIIGIIQTEQAFRQKQEAMRQSGASVSGSDDIDLLTYYSRNRAKVCEYKISERLKKNIANLFYYYGYATDENKIPSLNTRKWFNYIQCEADFDQSLGTNLRQDYINDLAERYESGVTILHRVYNSWDFGQIKANNERWIEDEF